MKNDSFNNQSLQKGAYIMLFTAVLTKLIGALFKIPISQDFCLGDLGFGYFSAAYDLYTPITTLAISGFPVAISTVISDYVASNRFADLKIAFKYSKKILIIISLVEFVLVSIIIYPFSKITDASGNGLYSLIAILPSILISSYLSLYRGFFEGFSNMKPPAISNIIEALGKLVLGFSFAMITLKITNNVALSAASALIGISVGIVISSLYLYKKYKTSIKSINFYSYELSENLDKNKLMRKIALIMVPVAISSLASSFVSLIDTLTVRAQLSAQFLDNNVFFSEYFEKLISESNVDSLDLIPTILYGIKGKAFSLFNIVLTLAMSIGVSVVPSITKYKSQNNREEIIKSSNASLKITTLISFPIAFGFIFIGKKIMALLFGNGESAIIGGKILLIYGIASLFAGVSIVLGNILQGMGCHFIVFRNIAFGIVLKVVFNLVLTTFYSLNIYGCCYSTLICYVFIFLMHIISFYKINKAIPQISLFLKPLVAGLMCGLIAFRFSYFSESKLMILLSILIAGVGYFVFLFALKFFKPQDFEELPFLSKFKNMCKKSKKTWFLSVFCLKFYFIFQKNVFIC